MPYYDGDNLGIPAPVSKVQVIGAPQARAEEQGRRQHVQPFDDEVFHLNPQ